MINRIESNFSDPKYTQIAREILQCLIENKDHTDVFGHHLFDISHENGITVRSYDGELKLRFGGTEGIGSIKEFNSVAKFIKRDDFVISELKKSHFKKDVTFYGRYLNLEKFTKKIEGNKKIYEIYYIDEFYPDTSYNAYVLSRKVTEEVEEGDVVIRKHNIIGFSIMDCFQDDDHIFNYRYVYFDDNRSCSLLPFEYITANKRERDKIRKDKKYPEISSYEARKIIKEIKDYFKRLAYMF